MAIRKLGPSGSEITLPSIAIAHRVTLHKKVERAEMSDGSGRYGFFKEYYEWEITFPVLTASELTALKTQRSYNQILRWQNNDESATWYNVVIINFSYDTKDPASPTTFWFGSMILEQAI